MRTVFNIYCDESCHLENDGINVMGLGAIWCPQTKVKDINNRIRKIKERNGVNPNAEIKWTKISPVKENLYSDIVDYFFDDADLHFRCVVVPNKKVLNHKRFDQTHDDWYYKMYFRMLKTIFSPVDEYEVYINIKDTNSSLKSKKLHEVCCNDIYDFSKKIIKRVQPIRSHEVQLMQLADVLIGAVCYENRVFAEDFIKSKTKLKIIDKMKERSRYTLKKTTLYREDKLNIFIWNAER